MAAAVQSVEEEALALLPQTSRDALGLLRRYLGNLLGPRAAACRTIRTTNRAFQRLDETAVSVLRLAGYAPSHKEPTALVITQAAPRASLKAILECIDDELYRREPFRCHGPDIAASILRHLGLADVLAAMAACRALRDHAKACGALARFCDESAWLPAAQAAARVASDACWPDWGRALIVAAGWRRMETRADLTLRASLQPGAQLDEDVLARALKSPAGTPQSRRSAVPHDLLLSLALHDGQAPQSAREGSFVAQGLRLLSLADVLDPRSAGAACTALGYVPATTVDGPHQVALDPADGSVWMLAGSFVSVRKASSWGAFLHILDVDVV